MKDIVWLRIVSALESGRCVLVTGPEISSPSSGALDPSERLTALLREGLEAERYTVNQRSLAAVAQQYEDRQELGPEALRAVTAEFYRTNAASPGPVHHALASLPFEMILSISHDGLLLKALREAGKAPQNFLYNMRADKLKNPEFDSRGTTDKPIFYSLFGDPKIPSSLILSENDLLDFLIKTISGNPPLPNSLVSALKSPTASFLFVGFGVKQWYLRILLKVLLRQHELGRAGNVIATEPSGALAADEVEQTIFFFQRGTRVELEFTDIASFLDEARNRLEARGGYKPDAAILIGRPPRIFISYASEDKRMAQRLFEALQKAGFEPWLDKEKLEGGMDWERNIEAELDSADFVLILYSLALSRKRDNYVNREIALAEKRASRVRGGGFLIPLKIETIGRDDQIPELDKWQTMPLMDESFDRDLASVKSRVIREFQRRNKS